MSRLFPIFVVIVFWDKIREWYHILRTRIRDYNAVLYVITDFTAYFYLMFPMTLFIMLAIANRNAFDEVLNRFDLIGAFFALFTWGSVVTHRVTEYFKKKMEAPP